ncbi:NADH:flavin oxidoreductase/NADH oxidase [Balneola sp. MJW-20]|uniref:NADH:flavin oxidoreductase/NADH oxidase n=1 Tax=Gracilimonas aurantiaca TaxID=3234185 RepID=UPI003465F600
MSHLYSPISFRSVKSRNRIMVSPMCQYSSENGFSNDWHLVHLGSRAVGGAGIVMTEGTAVSPEGRISYADLGIWKDEHIEGLRRITDFIKAQGAIPAIQLAHAGRKGSKNKNWEGNDYMPHHDKGWQILAPSPLPYENGDPVPKELNIKGIQKVKDDFKAAARRAHEAGFEIIEIHGAHGYLIHEFYSPLTNHRNDKYGGSFENRIRLLVELTSAVRESWPEDKPLFVRISASDWVENNESWDIAQSVKLSSILKDNGVDLIDVSSGGNSPQQKIQGGPGYQVSFSEQIRKESGISTGAVGMITEAMQAETILRSGQADLIIMAREFLRNPYFPLRSAPELHEDIEWPDQYKRAKI